MNTKTTTLSKLTTTSLMLLLAALTMAGAPASSQETSPTAEERERLREELKEAERQVRELRQQLTRQYSRGSEDLARGYADAARAYAEAAPFALPSVTLFGRRARLGITVKSKADEATDRQGAVLESVVEDGPAAKAGLEAGDIITHWDGEPLTGRYPAADEGESEPATKLVDLARELEEGDRIELTYLRDGKSHEATVEAAEVNMAPVLGKLFGSRDFDGDGEVDIALPRVRFSPENSVAISGVTVWPQGRWGDMELLKLGPELGEYFGTDRGLLVIERPDDGALGLEIGDVILSVGDRDPKDTRHLLRILRNYEAGETINVEVMRNKQRVTLSTEAPENGHFGGFGQLGGVSWSRDRSI